MGTTPHRRITILGCPIDVLTMQQTLRFVDDAVRQKRSIQHGVVDCGKLAMMHDDPALFRAVTSSDLINGEGQPLVWLSPLFGKKLPERVVGCELFENLIPLAHERGYKVYLFGAREEIVREVVRLISERHSPDVIAGWRNGYYAPEEEEGIARRIAASGAHILFVATTSPKKELFLYNYRDILAPVAFRMGVGGSFDVMAGKVGRAPKLVQKIGMEWFYRWIQEPRAKWKPVVADSFRFLYYLARQGLGGRSVPPSIPGSAASHHPTE